MKLSLFILYLVFGSAVVVLMMFGFLTHSSEHEHYHFGTNLLSNNQQPNYLSNVSKAFSEILLHEDEIETPSVPALVSKAEVAVISPTAISTEIIEINSSEDEKKKHQLLCVSFLNTTIESVLFLFANINVMKDHCDWAIVVLGTGMMTREVLCATESIAPFIVYCNRSAVAVENVFVPRGALFPEIAFLLPSYERALLLEEGVSLIGFDPANFLRLARCSFSGGYPMVSHPLLRESSSSYSYLLHRHWRHSSSKTDRPGRSVLAAEVLLLQPVAPMFDSGYLMWLIRRMLAPEAPKWLGNGFDWVLTRTLCGAAEAYAAETFNLTGNLYKTPRLGCVLITGAEPVHFVIHRSGHSHTYSVH